MQINDPEIQSRLDQDYRLGRVPEWNPNDSEQAQAFVTYWNGLFGYDVCMLQSTTTYGFTFIDAEPRRKD
jgi:hypothetical protein